MSARISSKIPSILDIPDLIEIQKQTFERFLQTHVEPEKRENVGLQAVFKSVFPIKDFNDTASLEFVGYTLEEPKYDVQECLQRGMTYAAPFKVTIRLVAWDDSEGSQAIRDVKEQEVYFGEIPIMTENGTFIINGTERVIVSQLHRSPGIFFDTIDLEHRHRGGQAASTPAASFPTAARGSTSSSTTRTCSTPASTGAGRSTAPCCSRRWATAPEELLAHFYKPEMIRIDGKKIMKSVTSGPARRAALHPRGEGRRRQRARPQGPQVHAPPRCARSARPASSGSRSASRT